MSSHVLATKKKPRCEFLRLISLFALFLSATLSKDLFAPEPWERIFTASAVLLLSFPPRLPQSASTGARVVHTPLAAVVAVVVALGAVAGVLAHTGRKEAESHELGREGKGKRRRSSFAGGGFS